MNNQENNYDLSIINALRDCEIKNYNPLETTIVTVGECRKIDINNIVEYYAYISRKFDFTLTNERRDKDVCKRSKS